MIARYSRRSAIAICLLGGQALVNKACAQENNESFEDLLKKLTENPDLSSDNIGHDELHETIVAGLETAPLRGPKSKTPISDRAIDLIIASEVSSQTAYNAKYTGAIWPQGQSGVTIGIGYDIGYVKPKELELDWKDHISQAQIADLQSACGEKGTDARDIRSSLAPIAISWKTAVDQFKGEMVPRYVGLVERSLENTSALSPDCLGALVSLVYNRGASFNLSGNRYVEMREISNAMESGNYRDIPKSIRSMKRIWGSNLSGLWVRRDAEAKLLSEACHKGRDMESIMRLSSYLTSGIMFQCLYALPCYSDALDQHPVETSGSGSSYESIHDKAPNSKIRIAASAVGAVAITIDQEPNPQCTGILIAPNKVLTARHCFYDEGKPPAKLNLSGGVEFWLDYYQFGKPYTKVTLDPNNIKMGSGDLDYAVIDLSEPISLAGRHIPMIGNDPNSSDDLEVIESRDGRPLEIVRRKCIMSNKEVVGLHDAFFPHTCDTQPSSSGSPIFDQDWNLVGIHVRGGKSNLPGTYNVALKISRVIKDDVSIARTIPGEPVGEMPRASARNVEIAYSLDNNETILHDGSGWTLRDKNGLAQALRLQSASKDSDKYLFWRTSDDTYLTFPKSSGRVLQRKTTGGSWTEYAFATRH